MSAKPPTLACQFCFVPTQPSENGCCEECREALGQQAPRRLPWSLPLKGEVAIAPPKKRAHVR